MTTATDLESQEDRSKRSPNNRRRPWRKRMKNFLLSPVHLVRKYVFRKSPSGKRPVSKFETEARRMSIEAAVQTAKQRKMPCYFLYLGLSQSGKSTTISKLFNGERPKREDIPAIKIHENSHVGNEIGMRIIDTPGILGGNTEEEDERIIAAIRSFLKRDLPSRIPTVTFITVPLYTHTDLELSQFSQMLKELSTIRKCFTDEYCSNIVLLLTHSQTVENCTNEVVPTMVAKYQEAFSKIFPSAICPVPAIAIENFRWTKGKENLTRYHDIVFGSLYDFAEQRRQHILQAITKWLTGGSRRFSVAFTQVALPISHFSDCSGKDEINEKLGSVDSGSDTDCETKAHLNCEPYFVMHDAQETKPLKKKGKKSKKDGQGGDPANEEDTQQQRPVTCIPEGSQVVLSNKTMVNIEDCLVGDKLLSMNPSRPSVITKIRNKNDDAIKNSPMGILYCSVKMSSQSESDDEAQQDVGRKLIYAYENESFSTIDASKANVHEKQSSKNLYFLEFDVPDGTFILNGFPCYSKLSNTVI